MNCPCDFEKVCLNPSHHRTAHLAGCVIGQPQPVCPARKIVHELAVAAGRHDCPSKYAKCSGTITSNKCTRCWEACAREKAK